MIQERELSSFIDEAQEKGVEYLIVICDTFDHDNYPVFCKTKEEFVTDYNRFRRASMQRIERTLHIYPDRVLPVDIINMKELL